MKSGLGYPVATDRDHECNAWCEPPVHARIMWTPDDPPNYLRAYKRLQCSEFAIEVIRFEHALECPRDPRRPEGYDFSWTVWYRYI